MQIFKVQLPIAGAEEHPLALVYNADRSVEFEIESTVALVLLLGGEPKSFWRGEIRTPMDDSKEFTIDDDCALYLYKQAIWQEWQRGPDYGDRICLPLRLSHAAS